MNYECNIGAPNNNNKKHIKVYVNDGNESGNII